MITKKYLEERTKAARERTGVPLELCWAYGRPRLLIDASGDLPYPNLIELSPRLPKPELADWLNAWEDGFMAGTRVERGGKY